MTAVRATGRVPDVDAWIVLATLVAKAALLAFGVVVVALLGSIIRPDPGHVSGDARALLEPWIRWDARHYLDIAAIGYHATDPGPIVGPGGYRPLVPSDLPFDIAFYPLYPALVAVTTIVLPDPAVAALVVSGIALAAAALLLHRVVATEEGPEVAIRSVWFLLIFPTAYFLHLPYTEGLFLALVLGSLLAARHDRWAMAGILGALAAATRANGLLLIPTLMTEAAIQWWPQRGPIQWRWLWIALVPLGFAAYLALDLAVYGDPMAFVNVQVEHWGRIVRAPWVGITNLIRSGQPRAWLPELAFIILGVLGTVVSARRYRPTWTVWMVANLVLYMSAETIMSTPRFELVLFPLFVWFAQLSRSRRVLIALSGASVGGLVLFAGRFALGTWAF